MFLGLRPGHQLAVTAQRAIYAIYVQDVTLGRMEDRSAPGSLVYPEERPYREPGAAIFRELTGMQSHWDFTAPQADDRCGALSVEAAAPRRNPHVSQEVPIQ
jgi:hypothetical protein